MVNYILIFALISYIKHSKSIKGYEQPSYSAPQASYGSHGNFSATILTVLNLYLILKTGYNQEHYGYQPHASSYRSWEAAPQQYQMDGW